MDPKSLDINELIETKDISSLKQLLESGYDLNEMTDADTKLHALTLACGWDCSEVVKLLLSYGADIHIDSDGPIIFAITKGDTEIFQILWDTGSFDIGQILNLIPSSALLEEMTAYGENSAEYYRVYGPPTLCKSWTPSKPDAHTWPGFVIFTTVHNCFNEIFLLLLSYGLNLKPVADSFLNWFNSGYHDLYKPFESIIRDLLHKDFFQQSAIESATINAASRMHFEYAELLLRWIESSWGCARIINTIFTDQIKHHQTEGWYHVEVCSWCLKTSNHLDTLPIKSFLEQFFNPPPLTSYLITCLELFHNRGIDLEPYHEKLLWHTMSRGLDEQIKLIHILREIGFDYKNVADRIHAKIIEKFESDDN